MTDFPINSLARGRTAGVLHSQLNKTGTATRESDPSPRTVGEAHGREWAGVAPKGSLVT